MGRRSKLLRPHRRVAAPDSKQPSTHSLEQVRCPATRPRWQRSSPQRFPISRRAHRGIGVAAPDFSTSIHRVVCKRTALPRPKSRSRMSDYGTNRRGARAEPVRPGISDDSRSWLSRKEVREAVGSCHMEEAVIG
jgi:hypothetical protein